MKNKLLDYEFYLRPPGTLGIAQESGWITKPISLKLLQHIQKHVKFSITEKVVSILDRHLSHNFLNALINLCKRKWNHFAISAITLHAQD